MLILKPCQSLDTRTAQPVVSEPRRSAHTVKVTNVVPPLSEEMLRMYFENVKRSHGGDINHLQFVPEKKKAFIAFEDPTGVFIQYTLLLLWHVICALYNHYSYNTS